MLIIAGQHGGQTFTKYKQMKKPMPVAAVIGYDPIMDFISGSPVPSGVCEYDVMGGYRGEPLKTVRCETQDLQVPADAEIVIEGYVDPDPATFEMEGPFGEYTGHTSDVPTPRPVIKVECVTYRNNPILRGTQEGTLPGSLQREQHDVFHPAGGHRLEYPGTARSSGDHQCARAPGNQRDQHLCRDQ